MIFGAKILRILLTSILALAIAMLSYGPLFVVLWPALYLVWHLLGRYRSARGMNTPLWMPPGKSAPTINTQLRFGLGSVRITGRTFIIAMLAAGLLLPFISIEREKHRAIEARAALREAKSVTDVTQVMRGGTVFLACGGLPSNIGFNSSSHKFYYREESASSREIPDTDAIPMIRQNMDASGRWCLEDFFGGAIEHFSFKVVFDRDSRVVEVTPLYGSFE